MVPGLLLKVLTLISAQGSEQSDLEIFPVDQTKCRLFIRDAATDRMIELFPGKFSPGNR